MRYGKRRCSAYLGLLKKMMVKSLFSVVTDIMNLVRVVVDGPVRRMIYDARGDIIYHPIPGALTWDLDWFEIMDLDEFNTLQVSGKFA